MIGISVESLKKNIIDRAKIVDKVEVATERNLNHLGGWIGKTASRSMRPRKGISAQGKPPSSHSGKIRDLMVYVVEMGTHNVVVGPLLFNAAVSKTTLSALEHGGPSIVRERKSRGRFVDKPIIVQPRPFMQPAFELAKEKAPKLWEECLK